MIRASILINCRQKKIQPQKLTIQKTAGRKCFSRYAVYCCCNILVSYGFCVDCRSISPFRRSELSTVGAEDIGIPHMQPTPLSLSGYSAAHAYSGGVRRSEAGSAIFNLTYI